MAPSLDQRSVFIQGDTSTRAGLTIMIVVVSVFLLAVAGLLAFKHYKRRQYHKLPQRSNLRSPPSKLSKWKSDNMSDQRLELQNELQRIDMIRKSLARGTSNHTLRQDTRSNANLDQPGSDSDEGSRPSSRISGCKGLEAGYQNTRAASLENHPALKQACERGGVNHRMGSPPQGTFRTSFGTSSLRSSMSLVMPSPAVASPSPPPYNRQNRYTLQHVPPPRKAATCGSRGVQPRRATFGVVMSAKQSGTFDTVPEEYGSVHIPEDEGRGRTWV